MFRKKDFGQWPEPFARAGRMFEDLAVPFTFKLYTSLNQLIVVTN